MNCFYLYKITCINKNILLKYKHIAFSKEQSCCGSSREQILRKLANAYDAYKELINNLQEGVKFYNDLTEVCKHFLSICNTSMYRNKTKIYFLKNCTEHIT
jgi:programmed cell death 6-interacting protein